jgi:predicted Ser/Thr protein kinase/pimeloyl-ACP methyl ester carboxylesterase
MHLPTRYVVGRELGRGGRGIVYEAQDNRLGRKVAIKVLHAGRENPARKHRFAQEARAASALNHPNIITTHDIDAADDGDFIVMELVEGLPLSRLSHDGPMAIDRAIEYALQIAGALAASHSADIIHRDLKPANVMVTREGLIKVLDFGLAKWTTEPAGAAAAATVTAAPHTGAGAILGSSGYMSPEQALGQPADARSDVFSFGVVLYELLAGRRAFDGESEWSAINALVHDQPTTLQDVRPDVPEALTKIVGRCLEKDRARRYPSAVELLDDLRRVAPAGATARPSRAARYLAVAAVVALTAVIGITWVDSGKMGYYGISAGANTALPIVAVEPRFKAVVLLSGGLPAIRRPPEADPINFAPHITVPTLMLNGRDDFIFPLETVAKPLFTLLGAPADRKRLAVQEGGHLPPLNELIRDVLGGFDQYLGPVVTRSPSAP